MAKKKRVKKPQGTPLSGNNPYPNVQPQSNNQPFNFPGAVL